MGLTSIKLGDYIERATENNRELKYGSEYIVGVNSQGIFTEPKGNTNDVDLAPYKIVNDGAFVYTPTRINLGSIAYRTQGLCLVSHLYIVFYLSEEGKKIIDPIWLYMYLRRKEFGREIDFRLFGSARPEFSYSDICDTIIPLPDIETQRKYVAVYNALILNQKNYEHGLDDLKISFEAVINEYKHKAPKRTAGSLLREIDVRNDDVSITNVQGINITKQFMPTVANTFEVNLAKYKVVKKEQFVFSGMQTGRDECIRIALYDGEKPIVISPAYSVFEMNTTDVLPEYVMMWFSRKEVDRLGWFMSDGSIRSNLDMDRFYEIEIPVPDISIQESIVKIYHAYLSRRGINESLKTYIREICPVLIKGAIEEARKEA